MDNKKLWPLVMSVLVLVTLVYLWVRRNYITIVQRTDAPVYIDVVYYDGLEHKIREITLYYASLTTDYFKNNYVLTGRLSGYQYKKLINFNMGDQ